MLGAIDELIQLTSNGYDQAMSELDLIECRSASFQEARRHALKNSSETDARSSAAFYLGLTNSPSAENLESLRSALGDVDDSVRKQALEALETLSQK